MKRQIKFRGYNLKNNKWLYGYYLVNRGKHYIVQDETVNPFSEPEDFMVDPESVGQYVGSDAFVRLYEGDIVRLEYENRDNDEPIRIVTAGTIKWSDREFKYVLSRNERCTESIYLKQEHFTWIVYDNEYERKKRIRREIKEK